MKKARHVKSFTRARVLVRPVDLEYVSLEVIPPGVHTAGLDVLLSRDELRAHVAACLAVLKDAA